MTPSATAADLYDALDADDTRRVDTRAAFISGYQAAWPRGLQAGRAEVYALRGYEAGRADALDDSTTALEFTAIGYTPEQQARADAIAAVAAIAAGGGDGVHSGSIQGWLLDTARPLAAWIEHGDPATFDRHVDDALGTIKDNPDLGDRVDQELDAAKMAQPRARPPHLQPITATRGFRSLPPIPGTHGGQPAGHVAVWESSAANGPHLWISASHPSDRNDPNSPLVEGCAHIRAEDAWRFAEQIRYLVEHHYQGSAIPESGPAPAGGWMDRADAADLAIQMMAPPEPPKT